jgi:subtilase family serine protease
MLVFRAVSASLVFAALGMAAGSQPVCPGPANFGSVRCHALVVTDSRGNPNASSGPSGYGPGQLITAYGLPTSAGAGQTIAIVDAYDHPNIENDLAVYNSQFGLPACTTANGCFRKVDQRGGTRYPTKNAGWALEISLDVEVAHGICPACKILLVEADSASISNLLAAEKTARTLGATVISNSWGASEFSSEASYDSSFNYPGVPITVSSGDNGYGVEWPAASQYVTAVGGTTLKLNANNTRASEIAWSGAGSGCSAYEPKPYWQNDTGCSKRTVADVSAVADPNTGVAVYDSIRYQGAAGWFRVGGTSLASPLVAAVYALAGNSSGTTYGSYPYSHTGGLIDITSGNNGTCGTQYLCTAVFGYDGPTGLGAPNGTSAF